MTLKKLASHTVDLDLLPDAPIVLDVGCRDYDFSFAVLRERPAAKIIAMDPAPDMKPAEDERIHFLNMALVGDGRFGSGFAHYSTGHGDMLTDLPKYYDAEMCRCACVNLKLLSAVREVKCWDLIKLDCEGSEFQILEMLPGPIATQISVEWHDFNQRDKYNQQYFQNLFAKLAPWYRVVQHKESDISGRGAVGFWDDLLVRTGT